MIILFLIDKIYTFKLLSIVCIHITNTSPTYVSCDTQTQISSSNIFVCLEKIYFR